MANKNKTISFDYDGVASDNVFEDGAVIITGRPEEDHDEIVETLLPKKASAIYHFPEDEEVNDNNVDIKVGLWKAKTIKKIGITKHYEDSDDQISIIQELNPTVEVVKVSDGIPQEKMNFIIFTFDGSILPVAYKLEKEGNRVIVGMIDNKNDTLLPSEEKSKEESDSKKKRLSLYKGMIDIFDADEVIKVAKRLKNKEEWFVLTDSNSNYKYTSKMAEMGFTQGIFPTEWDRSMEVNRNDAKAFVKEHYPDVRVAEVKTFKTVEEGIQHLNESEDFWVLKSLGDSGETIVPDSEDIEMARTQIISALEEMKSEYEQNGFILEQKIQNMIEITPEMIFMNGVPICSSIDIENKGIGAGNVGVQTGCMQNLIVATDIDDKINKIAFPEKVRELAKKHTGVFVWDISLLIDKNGTMWYGEFCSNRLGWDSFTTELAMACEDDSTTIATPFFSALKVGKNPLKKKYGAGVRMLNIGRGGKMIADGKVETCDESELCSFLYEVKKDKKGEMVSTDVGFDFGVVVYASDDIYEAVEECYEYIDKVLFEGKYYRPKFDFLSHEYESAILRRLSYIHGFIGNMEGSELSEKSNSIY